MPQHKTVARGHDIYSVGRPFLGHHYYTLSLPDLCPEVEKPIDCFVFYAVLAIFQPCNGGE